jgi:hypothetical protein
VLNVTDTLYEPVSAVVASETVSLPEVVPKRFLHQKYLAQLVPSLNDH